MELCVITYNILLSFRTIVIQSLINEMLTYTHFKSNQEIAYFWVGGLAVINRNSEVQIILP